MTKCGLRRLTNFVRSAVHRLDRQLLLGIFIGFIVGGVTVAATTPIGGVYKVVTTDNKFLYDGAYFAAYNETPSESGTLLSLVFVTTRGWYLHIYTDGDIVGVVKIYKDGIVHRLSPRNEYLIDRDMSLTIFILNCSYIDIDLTVI